MAVGHICSGGGLETMCQVGNGWWGCKYPQWGAGDDVPGAIRAVEHPPPVLGVMYAMGSHQRRAELAGHGVTHLGTAHPSSRVLDGGWAALLAVTWLAFASGRRCRPCL